MTGRKYNQTALIKATGDSEEVFTISGELYEAAPTIPHTQEPQKKKSYKELYEDALNGNEEALKSWIALSRERRETTEVVNEFIPRLDTIIESHSDPKRLNACLMRSYLYLAVSSANVPVSPKMNELLDEIIRSDNSTPVFLRARALFSRAINYEEGKGCKANPRMALKCYRLAKEMDIRYATFAIIEVLEKSVTAEDSKKIEDQLAYFSKIMQLRFFNDNPIIQLEEDEKTKLQSEISRFMEQAKQMCKDNQTSCLAENFLEDTCKKISDLAAETFSHRHQMLRILADFFFIPLGFVTLGLTLVAKKLLTGSYTFYGEKTVRENIISELFESISPK